MMLCVSILALILIRLGSINGAALLGGPLSLLLVASLASDAVACCLIFAAESRRRELLRAFGDTPIPLA
jgi:hypothetical protein